MDMRKLRHMPGILAQSVLFVAIFNGNSMIWERDLGIVHEFLASPTPRTALVPLGAALFSTFSLIIAWAWTSACWPRGLPCWSGPAAGCTRG